MKKLIASCLVLVAIVGNALTAQNLGQVGCSNIFGVPTNNILSQVTINGVVNSSTSLAANENFTGISIPAVNAGSNLTISATGTTDAYNNIAIFAYLDFN